MALDAIESMAVRPTLLRMTTKDFNSLVVSALKYLNGKPVDQAGAAQARSEPVFGNRGQRPGRVAVWLAGGSMIWTGWLNALMFTVVWTVSPLTVTISVTFRM